MTESLSGGEPMQHRPSGGEPMQEVADRLRRLEDRLERLLASGWRNAGAEAASLAAEGEALAEAGLPGLGERLAKVAAAAGGAPVGTAPVGADAVGAAPATSAPTAGADEALPAVAMALAATRLLRARLPADAPPPGAWAPLSAPAPGARKRVPAGDRVVPVCRVPHAEGEMWVGVRLRGSFAEELVLVEPTGEHRPWLRHVLEGSLRWQARHQLGASGDYQVCTVTNPSWTDLEEDALLLVPKDPRKDQLIFSGGGGLRLVQVVPDDLHVYAWLHPSMMEAARVALQHSQWALAWVDGALVAPLAVLSPGGLLRRARLYQLVPGAPAEVL